MKGKNKPSGRGISLFGTATKIGNKRARLALRVGEPWNEPLEVDIENPHSRSKDRVNVMLAVAFLVLLFALSANAMISKDHESLKEILSITKLGLIFVAVWAGGRAALKVLSGWKDRD